jgi:hypothetical protein
MKFLFETAVVLVGRRGYFRIYRQDDGKYFCQVTRWHQPYHTGPGDLIIWKKNKQWLSANEDRDVVEALGDDIDRN